MDVNNPVIQLCVAGTQAELRGNIEEATLRYQQAWDAATDDYDACIAAHYVARHQATPAETFYWNQVALERAEAVGDERVAAFMPSLYLNMGHAYELLDKQREAQQYYERAAALGAIHQRRQT